MIEGDLCAAQLHPRKGDGPCEACQGKPSKCRKGHDLTLPDALVVETDGRARCRECKRLRKAKARAKRRHAKDPALPEETPPVEVEETPTIAVPPAYVSRQQAALYRHAVLVRRQRGLL